MKIRSLIVLILLIKFQCSFSQNTSTQKDTEETISWLNHQFQNNKSYLNFTLKDIQLIDGEPILNLHINPGICNGEEEIYMIPLKKIQSVSFIPCTTDNDFFYYLVFETKDYQEIIWYQNDDKTCGIIGSSFKLPLHNSIDNDNLRKRIKTAFDHLMNIYGNDGKEKF
jgi:hypothetical protein